MDAANLRLWLAAPFASLFLILVLCVLCNFTSMGVKIPVVDVGPLHNDRTCDGRFEFVRLREDGSLWINSQEIQRRQLRAQIRGTMLDRAERVVYVVPEPGISYGRFADIVTEIQNSTDELHVAVLSGSARNAFMSSNHTPCDLIWPQAEVRRFER
jgi:biopolymer transport protein ExbD